MDVFISSLSLLSFSGMDLDYSERGERERREGG